MAIDSEFWTLAIANRMKAMGAVSGLAISMALAAPAAAQEADASAQEDADVSEGSDDEIVVTGFRAVLATSQAIKKDADTFVDVVTAEDIGALPDRSVAEALQRVPGVNVSRFQQQADPDRFSVEGSEVLIRGLNYTLSNLNGRDIFSANGGIVLSFNDLSPEIMGSIEIWKQVTADQIEGNVSGLVNLNTRKPLHAPGLHIAGTIESNYGDMAKEWKPGFSILGSNTFDTGIGTFGVQLGYSLNKLETRTDASQITDPCYRADTLDGGCIRVTDATDANAFPPADTVLAPKGAGVRSTTLTRDRRVYNGVLQWESLGGDATVTLEYLRAEADATLNEFAILALVNDDNLFPLQAPGSTWTFDNKGVFQTGTLTQAGGVPTEWLRFQREDEAFTEDFSASIQLHPTDQLSFNFEVQHLSSERNEDGIIYAMRSASDIQIDATGETPQVTFLPPAGSTQADYFTDPSQTYHWFALDNKVRNEADFTSMRADVGYEFDDGGFLRDVKFGARWADRGRINRSADFNTWGNLSAPWGGGFTGIYADDTREDINTFSQVRNPFTDFQRGNAPLPVPGGAGIFFGGDNLVDEYLDGTVEGRANKIINLSNAAWAGQQWRPLSARLGLKDGTFRAGEISDVEESTFAAYGRVDFGSDNLFGNGWRLNGNIGLRYAKTIVRSEGEISFPPSPPNLVTACDPALIDPNAGTPGFCQLSLARQAEFLSYFSGGTIQDNAKIKFDNWLPSINLKLSVSDEVLFRFGASKGMSRPDLSLYRTGAEVYANTEELKAAGTLETGPLFALNTGNRLLTSIEAWNYDLSAEWYFDTVGSLTVTGFIKDMSGLIDSGSTIREIENTNGATTEVRVNGPTNNQEGTLKGVEIAYQQTYDFLPGPLSGLGAMLTYTYIDGGEFGNSSLGSNAGAGRVSDGLPLAGISEHTVNAVIFWEKYGVSARAAYNYRSDFLQTARDVIWPFSPIYGESTGQLDASIFYNITDQIKVGVQGVNLLDEVTRTSQVVDFEGTRVTRSAFRNDRRYTVLARFNF